MTDLTDCATLVVWGFPRTSAADDGLLHQLFRRPIKPNVDDANAKTSATCLLRSHWCRGADGAQYAYCLVRASWPFWPYFFPTTSTASPLSSSGAVASEASVPIPAALQNSKFFTANRAAILAAAARQVRGAKAKKSGGAEEEGSDAEAPAVAAPGSSSHADAIDELLAEFDDKRSIADIFAHTVGKRGGLRATKQVTIGGAATTQRRIYKGQLPLAGGVGSTQPVQMYVDGHPLFVAYSTALDLATDVDVPVGAASTFSKRGDDNKAGNKQKEGKKGDNQDKKQQKVKKTVTVTEPVKAPTRVSVASSDDDANETAAVPMISTTPAAPAAAAPAAAAAAAKNRYSQIAPSASETTGHRVTFGGSDSDSDAADAPIAMRSKAPAAAAVAPQPQKSAAAVAAAARSAKLLNVATSSDDDDASGPVRVGRSSVPAAPAVAAAPASGAKPVISMQPRWRQAALDQTEAAAAAPVAATKAAAPVAPATAAGARRAREDPAAAPVAPAPAASKPEAPFAATRTGDECKFCGSNDHLSRKCPNKK
jgi:hypothetical protein